MGEAVDDSDSWQGTAGLASDIRYYGTWMREEAYKRIGHLYPKAKLPDGSEATVIAWLWARTVPCANPACGIDMPLMSTFQLSKKKNNTHWVKPVVNRETNIILFEVQKHAGDVPNRGTVNRHGAACIACGSAVKLPYVREQGRAGKNQRNNDSNSCREKHHRQTAGIKQNYFYLPRMSTSKPPWMPPRIGDLLTNYPIKQEASACNFMDLRSGNVVYRQTTFGSDDFR